MAIADWAQTMTHTVAAKAAIKRFSRMLSPLFKSAVKSERHRTMYPEMVEKQGNKPMGKDTSI
jgi:hypothetical protein